MVTKFGTVTRAGEWRVSMGSAMPRSKGWGLSVPKFLGLLHGRTLCEKQQPHFAW